MEFGGQWCQSALGLWVKPPTLPSSSDSSVIFKLKDIRTTVWHDMTLKKQNWKV